MGTGEDELAKRAGRVIETVVGLLVASALSSVVVLGIATWRSTVDLGNSISWNESRDSERQEQINQLKLQLDLIRNTFCFPAADGEELEADVEELAKELKEIDSTWHRCAQRMQRIETQFEFFHHNGP